MINFDYVNNLSQRNTDMNEHLLDLYGAALGIKAKTIVELGAGQSTYAFTAVVNETKGQLYSIDVQAEAHLRGFPEGKGVLEQEDRYHFIQDDSVSVVWDKGKIDFLLIDTVHNFNQTLRELEIWRPRIKKWGLIALHDTAHKDEVLAGTRKALDKVIKKYHYPAIHLLDTKHIGLSIVVKI